MLDGKYHSQGKDKRNSKLEDRSVIFIQFQQQRENQPRKIK